MVCLGGLVTGCDVHVSLGDEPDGGAPVPADCVPLTPTGEVTFGTQVVGRGLSRRVTVTNCSRLPRTLRARLDTAQNALRLDPTPALSPPGLLLGPLQAVELEVRFQPSMMGSFLGVLDLELGEESHQLTFSGAARTHPEPTTRVDCSAVQTVVVEGSLVFGPETTPNNPDVVLALHGLTRDQCFDVTGDVVIMGTSLLDLEVLGGLRVVRGRLLLGHEWAGNALLQDVDALANLVRVDGDLTVRGNPRLATLDGLVHLTRVGGTLTVHSNAVMPDVAGLYRLATLGGGLVVETNRSLRNLDGLALVRLVPGPLKVVGNMVLSNLDGLGNISAVDGDLAVSFNDALKSLSGLRSLTSVGPYLSIQGNKALQDLDGFVGVATAREVVVAQNISLHNLDGLRGLTRVTTLVVSHHPTLQTLAALAALETVDRHLMIQSNQALHTLGLDALTRVGGLLTIRDNPALPNAQALELAQRAGGTPDIRGNGTP